MTLIATIFFCLGAIDYIAGNKIGLGDAFESGFRTTSQLLILMTGFMVLAPWISEALAPVVGPWFDCLGCDPSFFAGMLLGCDAGGAILAKEMALTEADGLYNGMIVGSLLGVAITFTIPMVLINARGHQRTWAIRGLLIGFLTIPFSCVVAGVLAKIPLDVIIRNTWPVIFMDIILLLLFVFCSQKIIYVFRAITTLVLVITLAGFAIAFLHETAGFPIKAKLTPLSDIFPVICNIGTFLAGILPFMALLRRVLNGPLAVLGSKLNINSDSVIGFLISLANPMPILADFSKLDDRGCMLNIAFMTSSCFAVGDHLAFAMQFNPEIAMPLMIGKISGGLLGLLIAIMTSKTDNS